jgi:shikimate kinase
MAKPTIIFLAGFAGSGKTTVGRLLAKRLRWSFHDLDQTIVNSTGRSVAAIFAEDGERRFRRTESQALDKLCGDAKRNAVVALGGGTLLSSANRALIRQYGRTVYLSCSQAELYRRLRRATARPLLRAKSGKDMRRQIAALLTKRISYYKACDMRISVTGKTLQDVARKLQTYVS